jgi:Cu/Ag efflux pump CusA
MLALPAAFAGAFVVMALTGLSLNMITPVALLMAIGVVMDDAIVITDNRCQRACTQALEPTRSEGCKRIDRGSWGRRRSIQPGSDLPCLENLTIIG